MNVISVMRAVGARRQADVTGLRLLDEPLGVLREKESLLQESRGACSTFFTERRARGNAQVVDYVTSPIGTDQLRR